MNYIELCKLLNEIPDKKHKGRHLKKLSKSYDLLEVSKNNYEYYGKLTDIQIIEKNKTDKKDRMYLEPMIYTKLLEVNNNVIEMKMKDLLLMFGLVNNSYYPVKYRPDLANEIIDIGGYDIFIQSTESFLKRILYEVLIDMKDKLLIDLEFVPHGIKLENISNEYEVKSNSKYPVDYNLKQNDDIYEKYMYAYYKAMEENGYKRESKIKWFDIMKIRNSTAKQLNYDWIYFQYKISINTKAIKEYITNDFYGMKHSANYYFQDKIKRNNKKYELIADDEIDIYINMLIDDKNVYKFDEKIEKLKELERAKLLKEEKD